MRRPTRRRLSLLIATLLVAWLLPAVQAQDLGRMKVQRTDGKWVTGEVQETPDAYIVKVSRSITVTIRKNEVRAILPVEEAESQPGDQQEQQESENPDRLGGFKDAEIEKILEGTNLELPLSELALEESELPLDEESVAEMERMAGTDNALASKHVVIVYTSTKQAAQLLADRLESIWRWRMKFMRIIDLPVRLPEHKLELFYFASRDEFDAVCTNLYGNTPPPQALGFFTPEANRSQFFDMLTFWPVKRRLEASKKATGAVKAREENLAKRWSEFQNITVTQHELGHHIDFNVGLFPHYAFIAGESWDAMPTWLVEGTTMMFEVPPTAEGASLGAVNYSRLNEFKMIFSQKWRPELFKMFVVNNRIWHSGYFYPMGWALVYYLWEEKRPGLSQYYHIITARDPGDAVGYTQREREFEDCFGKIDQEWVDAFWKFVMDLPVKRSLLPPEHYP
jgi:hypothetical protein